MSEPQEFNPQTSQEVLDYYRTHGLPENFCPVPFSTLLFEANGNVCMCRRKGAEFAIGDIRKETWQEIWNGERLQAIRAEFLSGKVKTCAQEVARDRCNLAPDQARMLPSVDPSVVQKKPPLRITPNFNGHCNLECKMCHIWQFQDGLYDEIGFWKSLESDILPHLEEIDTFSGEPFIQKDTYRLIQLAHQVNPQILWSFTTNANWKLTPVIREHLDRIRIKTFNLSIDSLNEATYAEIRRKGSLKRALDTLDALKDYERSRVERGLSRLGLVLHVVLQKDNWRELPRFLSFRREKGIRIHLNCLIEPPELSLDRLSTSEREEVLSYYLESMGAEDLRSSAVVIRTLLQGLPALARAQVISEFQRLSAPAMAAPSLAT